MMPWLDLLVRYYAGTVPDLHLVDVWALARHILDLVVFAVEQGKMAVRCI